MTGDEWEVYQAICRGYDRANFKGEDLFKDLFETDPDGIIVFLRPPSVRQTSFEVFFFLASLMQQQHIRRMYTQLNMLMTEVRDKLATIK